MSVGGVSIGCANIIACLLRLYAPQKCALSSIGIGRRPAIFEERVRGIVRDHVYVALVVSYLCLPIIAQMQFQSLSKFLVSNDFLGTGIVVSNDCYRFCSMC